MFLLVILTLSKRPKINRAEANEKCPEKPNEFIPKIFQAIRFRDLFSVRYIVCNNPNVLKDTSDSGMDPLQVAIKAKLYGFAEDFITKYPSYVDFNHQNDKGNTCLHFAYYAHNDFIVCPLLEKGADKTIKNNDGFTPVDVGKGWEPKCNRK